MSTQDKPKGEAMSTQTNEEKLRAALEEAEREIGKFLSGLAPSKYSGWLCTASDRAALSNLTQGIRAALSPPPTLQDKPGSVSLDNGVYQTIMRTPKNLDRINPFGEEVKTRAVSGEVFFSKVEGLGDNSIPIAFGYPDKKGGYTLHKLGTSQAKFYPKGRLVAIADLEKDL